MMEPTEIDESGSLHFQAPKNNDDASPAPVRERKVSFNNRVKCRRSKITHLENLEGRWYTKEEITSFRQRDKCLQSLISSRKTCVTGEDDTEQVSLIGLSSERDRRLRIKRIREARACVMGEQTSQEEAFYENDDLDQSFKLDQETIADFYSSFNKRSRKAAHVRGLQVSWHVENLWAEDDEEDTTTATSTTDIDTSHRSCSQHSISTSNTLPVPTRNSSLRSAGGGLIARLSIAAA